MDYHSPRVAVVGAGISGLAAATSLVEKGFHVYLLEASNYLGGRLKQVEAFPGFPPVDLGGDFIHSSLHIVHQIAKENGWKVKKAYGCDGEKPKASCVYVDGKLYSVHDYAAHPDLHMAYKAWDEVLLYGCRDDFQTKDETITEGADNQQRLPVAAKYKNQEQVTGVSMATWMDNKGLNQKVIDIVESKYCQTYGATLNAGGVLEMAVSEDHWGELYGSGNYRLEGSYSLLISHFTTKCANVDKKLNWPVKQIKWKDLTTSKTSTVHITSQHGESLHVDCAVITVPLTILKDGDISFLPPLPATKQHAIQSIYMGSALKVVCRFKKCFWHETLVVYCPRSFLNQVWMYSRDPKPDGEECHVVVGFETAVAASQKVHLSDEEVCQRFVRQLDEMFGNDADPKPASRNLINFVYYHWSKHPYIRGGYSCPTVGTHGLVTVLAEPVEGRLFFAGEATHNVTSTVHSALETGIRAAEQICKVYGTTKSQL